MAKELTHGHEGKLILLFMLPLLAGNLFQQLYNISDTFIVGRTLGADAVAAVGSVGTLFFLVMGFAQSATVGMTIPMSRHFGAQRLSALRRNFATSIVLSAIMALVITVPAVAFSGDILRLMNTPADILPDATYYLQVLFAGLAFTVFYNLLANAIRAIGDSTTPLLFLVMAATLNIALDLVFILYVGMGVEGAALATVIAQGLSVVACAIYIQTRIPILRISGADFRILKVEALEQLRLGIPMGFQTSVIALGLIVIQIALNGHGAAAIAAYTVAQRIEQLAMFPFVSFGIAAGVFVAQNYGAGKMERMWVGISQAIYMSLAYAAIIGTLILVFQHEVISAFFGSGLTDEILRLGSIYLWVTVPFYPFLTILFVNRYSLQSLGNALVPTLAGLIEMGARVATALFIAPVYGFVGIVVCHPLAWIGAFLILTLSIRKKKRELTASVESPYFHVQVAEAECEVAPC